MRSWTFVGVTAIAGVAVRASAQTITLRLAHVFPESHYQWGHGGKPFTAAVTAATNGRVKFEVYPAAQLGQDLVGLLRSGIADMAIMCRPTRRTSSPPTSVAELPGIYGSS